MILHFSVNVLIGERELVLRIPGSSGEPGKEGRFKVTKMRCWRIMTVATCQDSSEEDDENLMSNDKLELSFEYLMSTGELQWVTIVSSQAILMSFCLQSIVEELLRMRNGVPIKKAGEKSCTTQFSFKKKDGSEMTIPIRFGLHAISQKVNFFLKNYRNFQCSSSILKSARVG